LVGAKLPKGEKASGRGLRGRLRGLKKVGGGGEFANEQGNPRNAVVKLL